MTGHKRALGWGTFFGGIFTLGASTLAIPFYPKRCIICGMKSSGKELNKSDNTRFFVEALNAELPDKDMSEERHTKKCPVCAETIKLEAIKCRFCGERFDPTDVTKQVAELRKENSFENRVLCSDGNCVGVIGPDGKCNVCNKSYEPDVAPTQPVYKTTLHKKQFYKKWWLLLPIGLGLLFIIQSFFGGSDNLSEPEKRLQKFNNMSAKEHLEEAKKIKGESDLIQVDNNTFGALKVKFYQVRRHLGVIKQGAKEYEEAQLLIKQIVPREEEIKTISEKVSREKMENESAKHLKEAKILSSLNAAGGTTKQKTIADFEASVFFKKQIMERKNAWDLRTGGINNSYAFRDSENPYSTFDVELTTKGQDVVEIGIHWNGKSTDQPAKITPKKMGHLTDLALFWGIGKQAKQIIDYAKSQQSKRYSGGPDQAPRKILGKITIHCGTTGETLWIGWK